MIVQSSVNSIYCNVIFYSFNFYLARFESLANYSAVGWICNAHYTGKRLLVVSIGLYNSPLRWLAILYRSGSRIEEQKLRNDDSRCRCRYGRLSLFGGEHFYFQRDGFLLGDFHFGFGFAFWPLDGNESGKGDRWGLEGTGEVNSRGSSPYKRRYSGGCADRQRLGDDLREGWTQDHGVSGRAWADRAGLRLPVRLPWPLRHPQRGYSQASKPGSLGTRRGRDGA